MNSLEFHLEEIARITMLYLTVILVLGEISELMS